MHTNLSMSEVALWILTHPFSSTYRSSLPSDLCPVIIIHSSIAYVKKAHLDKHMAENVPCPTFHSDCEGGAIFECLFTSFCSVMLANSVLAPLADRIGLQSHMTMNNLLLFQSVPVTYAFISAPKPTHHSSMSIRKIIRLKRSRLPVLN